MNIYTSNRLETLLDALAIKSCERHDTSSLFSSPLEVVVVQSLFMAKWLQQNVAQKNDIVARIEFPFVKNFIIDIITSYDNDNDKKKNIWSPDTLSWRIYKILVDFESRYEILRKYVAGEQRRRFQLAEKLAYLYDQYMVYRWDWIESWTQGRKAYVKPGSQQLLNSDHEQWQMELWQQLCQQSTNSLQHSLANFISKKDFTREQLNLPERVAIFGVTNMPAIFIDFFVALSSVCEVNFFYLNPCAEYWGDISTKKSLFMRESKDEFSHNANSLLQSWGLLGRDFLNLLLERTEFDICELFEEPKGYTALHEIQRSILNMQSSFVAPKLPDDSIQINACHNPRRELEVLHDYLLKTLQHNKHIEPRDIIVMAPDIEDYSAHIKSVFARENPLPFSISDQNIGATPLISTYKNILQLYHSRLTSNEILDIIEQPDVLGKFALQPDSVVQLRQWVKKAAIRWGKDAGYREGLGLPAFEQNSWKFGFDRLLAGYAFADDLLYEKSVAVPVDERGILLGKFKAAVDCFVNIQAILKKSHKPLAWCQLLQNILRDSFVENDENFNEHNFIKQAISRLEQRWQWAHITQELSADVVIKALFALIDELSGSYGFLDHGVTFCSLLPMRSVPAKVVCILGIDEGVFPSSDRETGFDLMGQHWRQGDRTKRLDDRYLFLESLLSARDFFYLSFRGIDENENSRIPPSIILSEFLEFTADSGLNLKVQYHPLYSFSVKYFDLSDSQFSSFSNENYKTAVAQSANNMSESFFCPEELDLAPELSKNGRIQLTLKDLADFVRHPAQKFLQHQFGINLRQELYEELPDAEPFEKPNAIEAYKLSSHLVEKLLERMEESSSEKLYDELTEYYLARGEFKPGPGGRADFETIFNECRELAEQLIHLQAGHQARTVEVNLSLPKHNVCLSGAIDRIFDSHFIPYHVGSNKFKHRFKHSISYLALQTQGEFNLSYCVKGEKSPQRLVKDLNSEKATLYLSQLVELYLTGMRRPLPFFSDCFDEYVKSKNPQALLKKKWFPTPFSFSKPLGEDEANTICFGRDFPGDSLTFADLISDAFEFFNEMDKNIWQGGL